MAKKEHVALLKQRVDGWNAWREKNPDIRPDLSGAILQRFNLSGAILSYTNFSHANLRNADLSGDNLRDADFNGAKLSGTTLSGAQLRGAKLRGADLFKADLRGADLFRADLKGADLFRADLSGASLKEADLREADLSGTDFKSADLSRVDLRGANLSSADFSFADFSGADFRNADFRDTTLNHAIFDFTICAAIDFRSVHGLAEIKHMGPSTIELQSIQLPDDGSARHFLRGVGTPEEWIDFYCATMMRPIQYFSVFISYSSADTFIAQRLHADLQDRGVRCWFAPHDLNPGDYLRKEIDQAIHMQDKSLLILSKHAIESGWVEYEVEVAFSREREEQRAILFPIRIDNSVLQERSHWAKTLKDTRHIGDFTQWTKPKTYQQTFDRLLRDLKKTEPTP